MIPARNWTPRLGKAMAVEAFGRGDLLSEACPFGPSNEFRCLLSLYQNSPETIPSAYAKPASPVHPCRPSRSTPPVPRRPAPVRPGRTIARTLLRWLLEKKSSLGARGWRCPGMLVWVPLRRWLLVWRSSRNVAGVRESGVSRHPRDREKG